MKLTFEEAKQKVAEKVGVENWLHILTRGVPGYNYNDLEKEATEIMAKSWANEAFKEKRDEILSLAEPFDETSLQLVIWGDDIKELVKPPYL